MAMNDALVWTCPQRDLFTATGDDGEQYYIEFESMDGGWSTHTESNHYPSLFFSLDMAKGYCGALAAGKTHDEAVEQIPLSQAPTAAAAMAVVLAAVVCVVAAWALAMCIGLA